MAKVLNIKLPKRIAGVKIPKAVRKGPLNQFINSSAGQLLIAEAIVAAGATYALRYTDPDSTVGEAVRHPGQALQRAGLRARDGASDIKASAARNSARLSFAFGEAVRAFRDALGEPERTNEGSSRVADQEVDLAKKKTSSSLGEPPGTH